MFARFPDHKCEPLPFVFGMGYLHEPATDGWQYVEYINAVERSINVHVELVGWKGIVEFDAMAARIAERTAVLLRQPSVAPITVAIGGFSIGAYGAIRSHELLQSMGLAERIGMVAVCSTSPVFEDRLQDFIRNDAPTDVDWIGRRMGERGKPTGPWVPVIPQPALIQHGMKEGDFIHQQAKDLRATWPRAGYMVVPFTRHPMREPGHAAAAGMGLLDFWAYDFSSDTFDPKTVDWHEQNDVRYTYTGEGSVALLEEDCTQPKLLSLSVFTCYMRRLAEQRMSPNPKDEDYSDLAKRYRACLPIPATPAPPEVAKRQDQLYEWWGFA